MPIEGKVVDAVHLCDCGVLHTRDDDGVRRLDFMIAAPKTPDTPPSAMVYVPFWQLDSDVHIHYTRSEGGYFNKIFGKDWKGGRVHIFVPAVEWDPTTYKHWAGTLTSNPPQLYPASSFGPYDRVPVTVLEGEAAKMADFLILSFEAEKPGTLQEISYEVNVRGTKLLYLPFDRSQGAFRPAF